MVRLFLVVVAGVAQLGCQAPTTGFNPFGIGQTRVPPPPTGVIGGGDYSTTPIPPPNSGASNWPGRRGQPGESYWQSTGEAAESPGRHSAQPASATSVPVRKSDQLTWIDPAMKDLPAPPPQYADPSVVPYPTTARNPPRLFPRSGSVTPLTASQQGQSPVVSSPPRVRGFSHAGVQELRVPAELAEFDGGPVRQAVGSAQWQSRY